MHVTKKSAFKTEYNLEKSKENLLKINKMMNNIAWN